MKKDVNELKKMFFEIVQHPGMNSHVPVYTEPNFQEINQDHPDEEATTISQKNLATPVAPLLIRKEQNTSDIAVHEDVEESLSIIDKEKELIVKALKKHRGKRKDAALDLGISERTLYRKLKEYDIEHL